MRIRILFSKKLKITRGGGKYSLIVLFLTAFFSNVLQAQNQYLIDVNLELRHIFSQITYPDNDVKFLYERSAKMSDSTFYRNNSPDTLNVDVWNLLYEEMYYSAHDTSWMNSVEDVVTYPLQFAGDTIVLGIMDYDFYHCIPSSLSTGNYFTFDLGLNQLFDHPSPVGSPYGRSNIFVASPLKSTSYFTNPVFRIDPNMFFTDAVNAPMYSNSQALRVDFGDGTGWHYFDISQLTFYQADYSNLADDQFSAVIRVEVFDWLLDRSIKGSNSEISVLKNGEGVPADEYLYDFPGITVGAYYPCEELDFEEHKVIIYIEGYDPMDFIPSMGNTIEMNYDKMIRSKYIEELKNFNYAFYVIDFEKSTLDLRINSLHVLNFIEYLKSEYEYSDEQFVVIGHSMGGVIGRFVLTYMESEEYLNADFTPFEVDVYDGQSSQYMVDLQNQGFSYKTLGQTYRNDDLVSQMHKVRTLITLDSPHQGANIPLSLQHTFKGLVNYIPMASYLTYAYNILLDSKAAKQLLIDHVDAVPITYSAFNVATTNYQVHPARTIFMNQLNQMGDYPKFCKLIAYSSADMAGSNQRVEYNDNFRTPGDAIADLEMNLRARILWIPINIAEIKLDLRTNPNGNGQVFYAAVGEFGYSIDLYWFGIQLTPTFIPIYEKTYNAIAARPYCVSAAGYYSVGRVMDIPASQNNMSRFWLFNLFSFNSDWSNGCWTANSHAGINGFLSTNMDLSLCSNGTLFGFVPLQSALDYGNGLNLPLNHNIQAENINTKLSRTPFDVIIGYTDELNHDHSSEYYDPLIFNLTGQEATNCDALDPTGDENYRFAYYNADLQSECEVKRSLMCLEIGDEEMYLENWTLNRQATFSAQYNMFVNERNPYYHYPSTLPPTNSDYWGIYSKDAPFIINQDGFAYFLYGTQDNPTSFGFVYDNEVSENWDREDRLMDFCVNNYAQGRNYVVQPSEEMPAAQIRIHLYPNPNNGEVMLLEYDFLDDSPVHLDVYDVSGKKVASLSDLSGGENRIRLYLNNLENGMYLVRVFTATQSQTVRLIIN